MELIERYLSEVGRRLPRDTREDICNELRSAINDALEDRSFGQATQSDVVAVLESFGSPSAVAASYSGDRYLIGPELYPQFVTTLKIVAVVFVGLAALGTAIGVLASGSPLEALAEGMRGLVNGVFNSFVTALGIVVLVFALLERLDLRIDISEASRKTTSAKAWNPLDLPAVRDVDVIGRFESIAGVVFPAVVLTLINQFRDRIGIWVHGDGGNWILGAASGENGVLLLNDVFIRNLPWINVSLILPMLLSVWHFWSGRWSVPTRFLKIAFDVFGVYVFHRICRDFVAARSQLTGVGLPEAIVDMLVRSAELAPIIVGILVLIGAVSHVVKIVRR